MVAHLASLIYIFINLEQTSLSTFFFPFYKVLYKALCYLIYFLKKIISVFIIWDSTIYTIEKEQRKSQNSLFKLTSTFVYYK